MIRRLWNFGDVCCHTPAVIILFIFILQFVFIKRSFGDLSVEGTPGPIPNPAVKLDSADGTWGAAPWESRSLPKDLFLFLFVSALLSRRVSNQLTS
jgi:hypothetical protein